MNNQVLQAVAQGEWLQRKGYNTYLGDGVYARRDETGQIWVVAWRNEIANFAEVALDSYALLNLLKFARETMVLP